jgi:hypothetical protein
MRRSILTTVALAHLMQVMCGAFRWSPYPDGVLLRSTLRYYMAMSGADGYYGFFAPVVDPEVQIRFQLVDHDGREEVVTLRDGATAEANLRLSAVGRLLPSSTPETRENLIRSLAAATLDKHPQAAEVTVLVAMFGVLRPDGNFDIPSMSEYHSGARSEWLPLQVVTLERPEEA